MCPVPPPPKLVAPIIYDFCRPFTNFSEWAHPFQETPENCFPFPQLGHFPPFPSLLLLCFFANFPHKKMATKIAFLPIFALLLLLLLNFDPAASQRFWSDLDKRSMEDYEKFIRGNGIPMMGFGKRKRAGMEFDPSKVPMMGFGKRSPPASAEQSERMPWREMNFADLGLVG